MVASASPLLLLLLGFIISLLFCALFAFMETCVTALQPFTIEKLTQNNPRYGLLCNALRYEHHRVLTAMLVANSFATIMATVFSTRLSLLVCRGNAAYIAIPTSILTTSFIMLLFGEVVPKHCAKVFGPYLIHKALWSAQITYRILYPLVWLFTYISHHLLSSIIKKEDITHPMCPEETKMDELLFLIEDLVENKRLTPFQHEGILKVLKLSPKPFVTFAAHRPSHIGGSSELESRSIRQ